jgi:hypothetical protein
MNNFSNVFCSPRGALLCAAALAAHAICHAQGNSANAPGSAGANQTAKKSELKPADFTSSAPPSDRPVASPSAKILTTPLVVSSSPNALSAKALALRASDFKTAQELMEDAKRQSKNQDASGAEQKLAALNRAKPDTAEWHVETSQRLLQLVGQLSREGSSKAQVAGVVTQSLAQLQQAEETARRDKDLRGEARAKAAAGFVHERYRGDPKTAIASYEAALRVDPTDAGAKEALTRLQMSLANVLAKTKASKTAPAR